MMIFKALSARQCIINNNDMYLLVEKMSRITGYLDYQTESELVGWIANLDYPDRLEVLICRGNDGQCLEFYPFVPRKDVCEAFNIVGRFGFAVPFSALAKFQGGVVSLMDVNGNLLTHGEAISVPVPSFVKEQAEGIHPKVDQTPAIVVLHIQKTAGTSLRSALSQTTSASEMLLLYPDGFTGITFKEFEKLPLHQRAALRLVIGHVPFGTADLLPGPADYVTFLRDPLARLQSHYLHHLANGPSSGGLTAIEMISTKLTDEFDNLMVRMIAGVGTDRVPPGAMGTGEVKQALHHIRTRFRFVGLVEQIQDHYRTMCSLMRAPVGPLSVQNTCQITECSEALQDVDWDQVMHRNRFDTMLYEQVKTEALCGRDLKGVGT